MTSSSPHLGDSHNFGRRVTKHAGRVNKPRTLVWEHLLLAPDSPLRQLLDQAAERDGLGHDAFRFLPSLTFYPSTTEHGGDVEHVNLQPLPDPSSDQKHDLAQITGRALALFSWIGVSDLHWENLVLGADTHDNIVFGPLDIEMILDDLALPTETKLLPDADPDYAAVYRHTCGIRRVLPFLGKPIEAADLLSMIAAYRSTLTFLNRRAPEIARVFTNLPDIHTAPIRVCLRGTDDYVHARTEPLWPPLLDAESEQLARGDIPYFFRLYGKPGIHYYADPTLRQTKRLPLQGDVPTLAPLLPLARDLRSPSRKKLQEEGIFTLIGAFDNPSFAGRHTNDAIEITFKPRSLIVKLPGGDELQSRRDLRAFVGSVYLPCRCGEVRSVFVPPVTTCEDSGAPPPPPRSAAKTAP